MPVTRALWSFLLATSLASVAHAAPADKQVCISASEKAQQLRADGKLTASREQLLTCARDVCPGVVRKDCARWLGEVEDALPTIVLAARDADGHDVTAVKVLVDDQPFADKLEGKAQIVDPGSHVFKFTRDDGTTVSETVLVREGEKNRIVAVTFPGEPKEKSEAAPFARDAAHPRERSVVPYVLGGLGVAALGSFAYFGITARNDASDLRATCAPACAQGDVDSVRTRLLVADISLGVSLVSFGVATYLLLSDSARSEPRSARVHMDLRATSAGGMLQLSGAF